jgi:hypothetical protein
MIKISSLFIINRKRMLVDNYFDENLTLPLNKLLMKPEKSMHLIEETGWASDGD